MGKDTARSTVNIFWSVQNVMMAKEVGRNLIMESKLVKFHSRVKQPWNACYNGSKAG